MNRLYYPKLNPVRFYDIDPVAIPQYLTKHYDRFAFRETIQPWEEPVTYEQKWLKDDIIYFQFTSNYSLIQLDVIDCNSRTYITVNATQVRANKFVPGWYVFEAQISLATLDEGLYFIKRTLGGEKVSISEPQHVYSQLENTIIFEYSNSRYHGDVIFETGIRFGFRVEAVLGRIMPGTEDEFYKDQPLNPRLLKSEAFEGQKLMIGGSAGVPDWVVVLLNRIWTCNSVRLDGKEYAKNGEAKFSFKEEDNYPMRGIEYEVLEGLNRGSEIVDLDANLNTRLLVVHNIEGKLFGDVSNQNNNIIQIIDIE